MNRRQLIFDNAIGLSGATGTTVGATDTTLGTPSRAYPGFTLCVRGDGNFGQSLFEIRQGATSRVIFPGLWHGSWSSAVSDDVGYDIPIPIPLTNEIIKAKRAFSTDSHQPIIHILPWLDHPMVDLGVEAAVAYGEDTTNVTGQAVTPGTTGKGSWAQIVASTTEDIRGLYILHSIDENDSQFSQHGVFDVGVDFAGGTTYQTLIPDHLYTIHNSDAFVNGSVCFFPNLWIPEGSRIAIRTYADNNTVSFWHAIGLY